MPRIDSLEERVKTFNERISDVKITDQMVFPPTTVYLPTPELLTFMINRAVRAKKDPETGLYGFIF